MKVGNLMQVGIRELRDNLSRRLDEVRAGRTITVTDHGRPIARLVPVEDITAFDRLVAEGRITQAANRKRGLPKPVVATGAASEFIAEQRG